MSGGGDLTVKVLNGAVAGVIGVSVTFPLDLVKTNLQVRPDLYSSIPDCFRKIYRAGGNNPLAFYRGLPPNLLFISPEKAIKLTCNDVFRKLLRGKKDRLPLYLECLAGGGAGCCQVVVTTPMELLKIDGQTKHRVGVGSAATAAAKSPSALYNALQIIQTRGIAGIYKGAGSTLLRDIPFSMTYFPLFAHLNHMNLNEDGTAKPLWSLVSGICAGAFAAWFFTPFDYIKTKIQAPDAPKGLTVMQVLKDTLTSQGGVRRLYTGAVPRAMVIAPLFGVAQGVYYVGVAERLLGRTSWDKPTV